MFLKGFWNLFAQRTSTVSVQHKPQTIDCSRHPSFNDIPNYWETLRAEAATNDDNSRNTIFQNVASGDDGQSDRPSYTEFEKRTALNQFKRLATTDCLARIAQGFNDRELVDEFRELVKLADVFCEKSPLFDDYMSAIRFTQTIKRRDAEYMAMLANDLHRPGCMNGVPAYELKLLNIARGTTAELSIVK